MKPRDFTRLTPQLFSNCMKINFKNLVLSPFILSKGGGLTQEFDRFFICGNLCNLWLKMKYE